MTCKKRVATVHSWAADGIFEQVGIYVYMSVERAARVHEQAVVAEKDVFIAELKGQVQEYRRTKCGPKLEKLDPAQMELTLEDLKTAIAETQARIATIEEKMASSTFRPDKAASSRKERKARALPANLPLSTVSKRSPLCNQ